MRFGIFSVDVDVDVNIHVDINVDVDIDVFVSILFSIFPWNLALYCDLTLKNCS